MKKVSLFLVALFVAVVSYAQPKAIGLRLSYGGQFGGEVSYEHILGAGDNFLEADLGMFGNGFKVSGLYNFTFAHPNWTPRGEWVWYAGPGAVLGYVPYAINSDSGRWKNGFLLGIAGQVGLEYTFWFPLQLSVDLRPVFGGIMADDGGFYVDGAAWGFMPTLALRYRF